MKHFGLATAHNSLSIVDEVLKAGKYQKVVLMLFDGMGMDALKRHLSTDSFLKDNMLMTLSAVFPSTTTAATTSMITGLTPGEHGWIGWTIYFKTLKKSIDIYWNTIQFTKEAAADFPVASTLFPYEAITDLIQQSGLADGQVISPFNGLIVHNLNELFMRTKQLLQETKKRYIYVYWPEPDKQMHQYGCDHALVNQSILSIERGLIDLQASLGPDDVIFVTADHGLVDSKPDFFEDFPTLENMLLMPPVVEPRAAALFVKKEHISNFPAAFHGAFGDHYILMTKKQALSSGLFGTGPYREELRDMIGDYFAVAVKEYALYQKHSHCKLLGMHAGLTEQEMKVPLIVIRGT
ncbi:MAG: alkaline phosphatase family protein [Clostridiales bacterium]|nr:alkaline phosphatase family protein [Clostridiales bacterium]